MPLHNPLYEAQILSADSELLCLARSETRWMRPLMHLYSACTI